MAILAINTNTTGLVGASIEPRRVTIISTDNLATVTAAGYLNDVNKQGYNVYPTDIIDMLYSFDTATKTGTFGIFQPSFSGVAGQRTITLDAWENPGNVLLPVVSGNIADFNGTSGQIKDSGVASNNVVLLSAGASQQIDDTLITYKDNATSFRLKGPSSPNDPSAGADVQSYSGMFYNDSYSNFGVLKTRATFGANTQMDLTFQAPRALLLIAYDGTQSDGVIKMASQTGIEFAPRSSAVSAPGNYAYFDTIDTTVDSGGAVSLDTAANHLYLQYGKTTQVVVLPTIASGSLANAVAGALFYDTGTNKLMFYNGSALETVTSST